MTMTAAGLARALGNTARAGRWWRCRCPVHQSAGPTLALRDGMNGLIAVCHAGCPYDTILAELRNRGLVGGGPDRWPAPVIARAARADTGADSARRIAMAQRIWDAARNTRGSPVVRYAAGRAIAAPLPTTLRYAPALRRLDGTYGPAMVALVEHVDRGIVGVHRTWLARDALGIWGRRDRASLGPIRGGAVRLAPAGELLMVGEGVETALCAMQATTQPAWAALSTSGMIALELPSIARQVIILADHDASGAGERAARIAAQRWLAEGRRVRLALPPEPGTDFNDVLAGAAYARIVEVAHA